MKRAPKPPMPCKCGCGRLTVYPVRFATEECKAIGKRASMDRNNEQRRNKTAEKAAKKVAPVSSHPERFGVRPHRPAPIAPRKPLISEEEQTRLRAIASAEDRAWHARFMKERLGLESAPGQPLASKVTRPPVEVWKQYEEQYRPLRNQEKEFHLPLRADIGYN